VSKTVKASLIACALCPPSRIRAILSTSFRIIICPICSQFTHQQGTNCEPYPTPFGSSNALHRNGQQDINFAPPCQESRYQPFSFSLYAQGSIPVSMLSIPNPKTLITLVPKITTFLIFASALVTATGVSAELPDLFRLYEP
jgi:hypothetical protein